MPTESLPCWDDQSVTWTRWKAAIVSAGKKRVYASLAPILLDLSKRVTDANHTSLDKSLSMRPSERRRIVVEAIKEVAGGISGPTAARILSAPGDFTRGVSGTTLPALGASVALIEAMCASHNFERPLRSCLIQLSSVDRTLVEQFRRALSLFVRG